MKFILRTFIALVISLFSFQAMASHLMGGDITYECVGPNTYIVKVDLYRDCNGVLLGNSIALDISNPNCGTSTLNIPLMSNSPEVVTQICSSAPDVCNDPTGLYGVQRYTYVDSSVVLGNCTDWTLSYSMCCRNGIITTTLNSPAFYISTTVSMGLATCNNSPTFDFDPLFYACVGDTSVYTHGVHDVDNDDLIFSLIDCAITATTAVPYNPGFSGTSPLTTSYLEVDSITGAVRFVPSIAEVGVICMLVEEYRNGVKIGEVVRDIQIDIKDCLGNQTPVLSGINGTVNPNGITGGTSINLYAGQSTCFTIDGFDANTTQTLAIEYINSLPGATYTINSTGNTAQVTICWTPTLNDLGSNHFAISIEDDACPIVAKNNYAYIINVLPTPAILQGTVTRSDGLPLSHSKIYTYINLFTIADSTTTDSLGFYSLTTFDSSVKIQAIPSAAHLNQQPTFYQNATFYNTAMSVSLSPSVTVTADFSTLFIPTTLGGTVVRHDGQVLDNSWVHLMDSGMAVVDSIQTNTQGQYSFTISDATIDYYIKATPGTNHGDQVVTYYDSSLTIQNATAIEMLSLVNFANFNTFDTTDLIGEQFIGGTVSLGTDFTPTPLADVRLILNDANGNFINDVITDDDGQFRFNGLSNGTYRVFVDKVGINNNLAPTIVIDANESSPEDLEFLLHSYYLEMFYATSTTEIFNAQNIAIYPNPIQTTFTIEYNLTTAAAVSIDILDVTGRVVSTILNKKQVAGEHLLKVNETANLSDGVYFVRISIDGLSKIQKIIKQ